MRKYILALIIIVIFLGFFGINKNVLAQIIPAETATEAIPLEIDYPIIPDSDVLPPGPDTTLPRYIEYVFHFLIWGSGILALLALIYGGYTYITSVGNPDKLRDARDRIISAILGLLIVLGSYVILWQINPQFLNFELPELKPSIKTVSPGVWICQTGNDTLLTAWFLEQIYMLDRVDPILLLPPYFDAMIQTLLEDGIIVTDISDLDNMAVRRQIRDKIETLLEDMDDDCYKATTGEIRKDFNDKDLNIFFVPEVKYEVNSGGQKTISRKAKYGAALFDDDDFTGLANIYIGHFYEIGTYLNWFLIREETNDIKVSSIQIFKYNYDFSLEEFYWTIKLYEEKNYNVGFTDPATFEPKRPLWTLNQVDLEFSLYYGDTDPENPYKMVPKTIFINLPIYSPKSIRVGGDVMVVLYRRATVADSGGYLSIAPEITAGGQTGRYLQIFFKNDNNLEDNYNIVRWDQCPGYQATTTELEHCTISFVAGGMGPGGGGFVWIPKDCCAKADSDAVLVVPNIISL